MNETTYKVPLTPPSPATLLSTIQLPPTPLIVRRRCYMEQRTVNQQASAELRSGRSAILLRGIFSETSPAEEGWVPEGFGRV